MRIQSRKQTNDQRGFTIIEAVVSAALFATIVSTIVGVYLYTVKINRRADIIRQGNENARFISEFLSKEVRNGTLNYTSTISPCNSAFNNPDYRISIISVEGDQECLYLGDGSGNYNVTGNNLWLKKNALSPVMLNNPNTKVTFFQAFNPNRTGAKCVVGNPCTQPSITIGLRLNITSGSQDNITIPISTAVSMPEYDLGP